VPRDTIDSMYIGDTTVCVENEQSRKRMKQACTRRYFARRVTAVIIEMLPDQRCSEIKEYASLCDGSVCILEGGTMTVG